MTPDTCSCPQCHATLRTPPSLGPGDRVRCPRCHADFPIPEGGTPAGITEAPPPREDVRRITEEPAPPPVREYRYPHGEEVPYDEDYPRPGYRGLAGLSSDYTIDLNEWFRHATANWGAILGGAIGWLILVWVIDVVLAYIPCIGPIARLLIDPALWAGITIVCLRQLRGRGWTFGDFFSGFRWWGQLFVNQLIAAVLMFACALPTIILAVASDQPGRRNDEALIAAAVATGLVGACVLTYFGLRGFFFATQLIVDRNCGPVEAIQGSWALTRDHFWGLLGVSLLLGIINLAGLLLCLVGLLFTLPLTALVTNAGYLIITGRDIHSDRDRLSEY
jgi:hypothetical protein